MTVSVWNIYGGEAPERFTGTAEQVHNQLRVRYEWLNRKPRGTLQDDVNEIQRQQALFAEESDA